MLAASALLVLLGNATAPDPTVAPITQDVAAPGLALSEPEAVYYTDEEVSEWYGLSTLAVDGVALTTLVVGAEIDSSVLAGVGLIALGVGAPMVHASHGRNGAALGSMALRVGLTFGGAALGASSASCSDEEDFCGLGGAAVGGLTGFAVAVAIDHLLLARATRTVRTAHVVPRFSASADGAAFGVAGVF